MHQQENVQSVKTKSWSVDLIYCLRLLRIDFAINRSEKCINQLKQIRQSAKSSI